MPDGDGEELDAAGLTPAERRILQDKARRTDELESQLAHANQQLAIRDAGLDLSAKQLKALEATHEGEWTPEAIHASAVDLGFAAPKPPTNPVGGDEQDTQRRIAAASNGADSSPPDKDADFDAAAAALKEDVRAGRVSPQAASERFDQMYRAQHPDRIKTF